MPLDKGKSQKAFKANVKHLVHTGRPVRQAVAIAYSIMRGDKKEERCWSGYEPVPGKEPYSPGSCKKETGHD